MADPKIKYDIEAAVSGTPDAAALAKELRNVGDALEGDLKTQALQAADALDALGSKQRALDSFQALKRETTSLATALDGATAVVDRLGNELPDAAAKTQALATAEGAASAALTEARASVERKREALAKLREENTGAARRTDEYRAAVAGLQAGIKSGTAEIKTHQTELSTAARATTTAQNAEAGLRKEYDLALGSATKLSTELRNKNAVLGSARDQMQAMGVSTTGLAQSEANLRTAVAQVRQEVQGMAPAYQAAASASSAATQSQAQNQRTLREGMTSISTQLQQIQNIATIALGGGMAGGLIKDVAATADEFKNLEARIKLVTGEGPNFQASFDGVTRVALQTNSALDATGTLFARIAKAGQEAGMSAQAAQQDALGLTTTINQAIQLSGSSSDASNAAITQLIQGLQSGVLRGEEFNSVMEQAPRLAQALANGLGVTTGELRKMAEQGALTTTTVTQALRGQADAVASEFGKLPPTVGRALQNLSTEWTLYVGAADKGLVSSANGAKVINALAQNLDVVVGSLTAAGKAWAAIKIAGLVADFARWATTTLTATKAVEANTVAAATNTVAQRANAAAQLENAAAQSASTAATTANTTARAGNAAAWSQVGTFTRAASGAQAAATATTVANTAAVGANAAKVASAGIVWRSASALMGPWGIALAALTPEIVGMGKALGEQAAKWAGWGKVLEQNEAKLRAQDEALKAHSESLVRNNALLEDAKNKQFDLGKASVGLLAQFDKLIKDGDSAAEAIGKIGKDFDLATVPGIKNATSVLDKLLADGKLTASEFQAAWAKALDGQDLAKFEVMARTAFAGTSREAERMGQVMDASLRAAVQRTGLDFEVLQGKIGAASRSAINDTESIVAGLVRLKAEGVDTGKVLTASIGKGIETADSEQAIRAVSQQIESLRKVLGDKIADGLLDQAAEKARLLGDAADKAKPGVNSLREAFAELGMKTPDEIKGIETRMDDVTASLKDAAAQGLITGDQLAEGLEKARAKIDEIKPGINSISEAMKTLGVTSDAEFKRVANNSESAYFKIKNSATASLREINQAFKKFADDQIAANDGVATEWIKNEAALRGYTVAVDEAGKATVKLNEGRKSSPQLSDQAAAGYDKEANGLRAIAEASRTAEAAERSRAEAADTAERKRLNIDKEGFSTDKNGQRLTMGSDTSTLTGIAAFLKAAGVDDDAAARKMALEFSDGKGNIPYFSNPGQIKYGGRSSTMSMALLKAAETYTFSDKNKATSTIPKPDRTVNVNININNRNLGAVATDAAGASILQQLVSELERAKSAAGV